MQIITDANGRIIAMCPAENEPVARPKRAVALASAAQVPNAAASLVPRSGQLLHVIPWPAELAGLALAEIHTTYRVVVEGRTSRLERTTK